MDQHNIRTFKDFLEFYNVMSQTCFSHCIDSFKRRELEPHEIACVEKCAHKLIRFNNRSIHIYADVQAKLMMKRQKDLEQQQIEQEAAAAIQADVPETTIPEAAVPEATN